MNDTTRNPAMSDSQVFRFACLSIIGMLVLNVATTPFVKGWIGAAVNTALVSLVYVIAAFRGRNPMLSNWLLLALLAGWAELAADWWLVTQTKTLVYAEGPKVVVSPVYMPFAWMLVIVQVGLVGQWFARRFARWKAALLTGLLAGTTIPFYESLARFADWWVYVDTPMFLHAPWYIILGEFLLGVPLVYLGLGLAQRFRPALAIALGLLEGAIIWVAYYLAFALTG